MAYLGSFDATGGYDSRTIQFQWEIASQSVQNNTTVINWSLVGVGGYSSKWYEAGNFKVIIDGATVYSSSNRIKLYIGTTIASGQYTFFHNADGTKEFTAYIEAGIYYYAVNATGSRSFMLETIPRASTLDYLTTSTNTLTAVFTYKYTPKTSAFYNRLRVSIPNVTVLQTVNLGQKSASQQTATYTLSSALLESIYTRYPNTSKASIGFVIETYSDSGYTSKIGESAEMVKSLDFPPFVKPTCNFTYSDSTPYYSIYGKFVQNKSALSISVTTTLAYGSPIKSYSIQVDGRTYTSQNITTSVLVGTGTKNIVVYVTDNRGRQSDPVTKSINILPYQAPIVTLTAIRCNSVGTPDNEGSYMKLSINGTISSLEGKNSATYEIKYKKSTDNSWATITGLGASYTSPVLPCDVAYVWNIEGKITDQLSSTTKSTNIPIAFVLMDFHKSGKGITFGSVATEEGFNVNMPIKIDGIPINDFVIEEGSSNGWHYVKRKSGKLIMYGKFYKNVPITTFYAGNTYYGIVTDIPTMPISFVTLAYSSVSIDAVSGLPTALISDLAPNYVEVKILDTYNTTRNVTINILLIGTWK